MEKSETISLTYEIGKAVFTDLPKMYEHGSIIQGKVCLISFYINSELYWNIVRCFLFSC